MLENLLSYLGITLLVSFLRSPQSAPVVTDASGLSYIGLRNLTSGQDYFLGIPYAEPPIGSLRFKPPVAWSRRNTTAVKATKYGYTCVQQAGDNLSEDCLTLNIWKPTNVDSKLPVMVWILTVSTSDGGGFYAGSTEQYPGNFLVERAICTGKPVIYVAMNYRLGLYGFPPGQAASDAGASNLGLKDQRLALEWIQNNIASFGGDPEKVTLFGESAGALSVEYQAFYKGGDIGGVFRGMIPESGSPSSLRVFKPNDPIKEEAFKLIAKKAGCDPYAPDAFECVRGAPAEVLEQANKDLMKREPYFQAPGQAPTVFTAVQAPGDDFLVDDPSTLLDSGKFAKVPFINGAQLDEGTLFGNGATLNTDEDVFKWITARSTGYDTGYDMSIDDGAAARRLLEYYSDDPKQGSPYGTGEETFGQGSQFKRFSSIFGDLIFQAPRRQHLRAATKFGVKSWSYIFFQTPADFVPAWGVRHGGDIAFVFQMLGVFDPSAPPELLDFVHTIADYWLNFAYYLDPNSESLTKVPYWPPYDTDASALQLLANNITSFKDSFRAEAIDFIIRTPALHS
ncbi:carbohydrate esterase family 10 protein [Ceratobasidium sp. AG-Ba]|nr:carbohydrate esterase family 10 protein [Ceratobasidium sp. AG-Ba]